MGRIKNYGPTKKAIFALSARFVRGKRPRKTAKEKRADEQIWKQRVTAANEPKIGTYFCHKYGVTLAGRYHGDEQSQ